MMEAENKTCHEVQVQSQLVKHSKTHGILPLGNHGANLARSRAEAKLLDTGDYQSSSSNCVLSLYQPFNGNASKSKAFIS